MFNDYNFLKRLFLIFTFFTLLASYNVIAQDTDGDGVDDLYDLDDDNDGILDTDECAYEELTSSDGSSWTIYGSTRAYDGTVGSSSYYNIVAGEVYLKTGFFTDSDGNIYDLAMDYVGSSSTSGTLSGTVSLLTNNFSLRRGDPSNNEYFEVRMYFVLSGDDPTVAANHVTFDQVEWTLRDIDNNATTNFSEVAGFPGVQEFVGADLGAYTLPGYSYDAWGLTDNTIDESSVTIIDEDHHVSAFFGTQTYFNMIYGVSGSATDAGNNRQANFTVSIMICPDTDGDLTKDYLDTDSDNDGCVDADEAYAFDADVSGDGTWDYGLFSNSIQPYVDIAGWAQCNSNGATPYGTITAALVTCDSSGASYVSEYTHPADISTVTTGLEMYRDNVASNAVVCPSDDAEFEATFVAESYTFTNGIEDARTDVSSDLTYQWYYSDDDGVTFTAISSITGVSGENTDTLTVGTDSTLYVDGNAFYLEVGHATSVCTESTIVSYLLVPQGDNDNDGIPDDCDLDDDNDGIYDTDEQCGGGYYFLETFGTLAAGSRADFSYDTDITTEYTYQTTGGVGDGYYALFSEYEDFWCVGGYPLCTSKTWDVVSDHTGDTDGAMLLLNAGYANDVVYRLSLIHI